MKLLESLQFWEGGDEGSMHVVVLIGHQLVQGPEGVLLRGEVHQEEGRHLGHALAVAHLRVVHAVGGEHMEELLLLGVVSLPEHDVVPVGSVHVEINLSDLFTVQPSQVPAQQTINIVGTIFTELLLHLLVFPLVFALQLLHIEQYPPGLSPQALRYSL